MKHLPIVFLFAFLCACAATGPLSAPVAAGAAAAVAVFDQLLAGGVIDPMQHHQLVQSITAIDQTVTAVQRAQEGTLTSGEAATYAGGITATILGAVRAWRGPADKKAKTA